MSDKEDAPTFEDRPTVDPGIALRALRNIDFRWFIAGRMLGSPTGQMRAVVRGWLVYNLTGSALALGWVSAASAIITIILAPFGGLMADRFDKRHVMLAARIALIADSSIMVVLLLTGWLRPWHIAAVAVLESTAFSFMGPAQRTVVSELVDRKTLFSALSVTSVFEGLMGVVGAALAGWMTETVGPAGVYAAMATLFAMVGYTLQKLPPTNTRNAPRGSVGGDITDGMRYLRRHPVLLAVLGVAFMRVFFSRSYTEFQPAYVEDTLGLGASGLGLLTSASAAGALISALVGASLGNTRHKGKLLLGAGIGVGICLILFVQVPVLPLPFILVALESGFSSLSNVLTNSLIQLNCRVEYRARIDGLRSFLFGFSRLIVVPAGALVDAIGLVPVITMLGGLIIVAHLIVAVLHPPLRRMH